MTLVSRADLERVLDDLRVQVADPAVGIHGPGSPAWTLQRETLVFLGGGRAALLQLAHPYVAHGIDQHSRTRDDIIGRFERTFTNIFSMTFGDLDDACRAARRVHNIHTRVVGEIAEDVGRFRRGHRYAANDLDALTWVYATLIDTVIEVYERVVGPLSAIERERYYQDTTRFAALFGIPRAHLPADWAGFRGYFDRMLGSPTIAVGAPARDMGRFVLQPPRPELAALWRWYAIVTAGLLPPSLREPFGLPFGRAQRLVFAASMRALRLGRRLTPPSVAYLPRYVAVDRRLRGLPPSRASRAIARALFQTLGADPALLG